MADWSSQNITLTAKGASALSKVQAGSGSLTITRVVASEQYVAESTLREVTSLSVENLPLTIIDRHEVQDGGSVIQVQLSNLYLGKAFTMNEIGVFATHSDNPSEEFLYIIAQVDTETGDKIPVYATTPVTATYDIYLYNVGADNVQITISSAGLVTYEALNKACDIIQRNTAYEVGDILHSHSLKKGLSIKCTVAGTTKSTDTDLSHKNVGDTVEDGTSQWVVIAPSTTADFDAHNHSVDAHPELMKQLIKDGLNVIKRSHSYAKGDIAYSDKIPSWAFLECIVAGTTSDGWHFPKPSEIKVDDTIVDYTVTWKVRKVADTASKLATARNIALTGNASGSATFDGSSDANISVTVNESKHAVAADIAMNADKVDGIHAANLFYYKGSWDADNWGTIGTYQVSDTTDQPVTSAYNHGQVITSSTTSTHFQLYAAYLYRGTGRLHYRTGFGDDKQQPWNTILDSENYNLFAPTKLGGGAKGTWGISITGNAKTATTATSATTATNATNASHASSADSATNADTVDGYHASDLLGKIYPVGSIYMSMSATNPHDLFGVGTWKRISQGRMLLGADDSTYEAGATGGEETHTLTAEEMPAHSHTGTTSWANLQGHFGSGDSTAYFFRHDTDGICSNSDGSSRNGHGAGGDLDDRYSRIKINASHNHTIQSDGGSQPHNNMPPYLVCYIWQRTA